MKTVIFIHVLYLILIRTFMVKGVSKCDSKIELRAILLSCPIKDSGCDDDDPLSQAMSIEEEDIDSKTKNYEAIKDDEKNYPNIVKDCKRKLIITVKIKNTGKISCDDEYIVVDHVFDPLTGGKGRLLSPMVLKIRQEQMIQLYALKFQRVVNSDPYEEHKEPDKEVCSVAAENPTCGTTMYDGKPIPFSEGFCCSRDPFLNAKRQLTPSPRKDSIFHRDSKLIPQGAERFIREQTSYTTIVNPRLVKLKSGSDPDANAMSKDDTKEDLRVKDLTDAEKIPNFMLELDRKIVCDKGDFLKELCKMEQEKVKTLTTPEPFGGPTKAEATTVTSKSDGEKNKNKGHKAPKSNEEEYVTIPIVVTDENQNEILLKNLLQALNKNNENQNKVSGPPPIRKLSELYNQLKSGEGVRGKRENPLESSMPRTGRKLTLEENLENFINLKKGFRNRRKRLLELSHKRFHKTGIHCRDLSDCPTIMVTEFPNDFIRSPPPSYFFAHDKNIIDPMDPSQLISNSTCRSYEDTYYDESSSFPNQDRQKEFPYKNEKGETPMPYKPTQYCDKIQTKPKEKHQKTNKNEKNPHPAGGQTQKDVSGGKKNVEEIDKSHVGKNFLRGDKRLSFEESNNHEYKGINELLVKRGRKEENAGRPEEKLEEEIHIRNYKPQKPHFKSKDIKDLLLKGDDKKISKSKIRNFMLTKNREKLKFKTEFRKIPKKEEEKIIENSEKSNEYKKGAHPEEKTSDVDVEESVDERKEEQPLSNTPAGELEHDLNAQHENQDGRDDEKSEFKEQKSKFLQQQREEKLRKQGTPLRGRDEENTGSVDFDVEIIREGHPTFRKNIHYSTNVDKFSTNRLKANANRRRLETYLMNHLNRNAHQLNGKNVAFQYRYPQRYDFSQKGHFIDKHIRLNPEVMMTHRFYVNEPELGDHHSKRINNRGQQKRGYYHVKPLKNHRIHVVDYTDHNSKLQRQSLLNGYDNNKLHNSQHQGKHQREIFSREYAQPKANILIRNDDQDLGEATSGKIRNKRTVGYSFEPARGFLTSELNVFEGEGEPKLKDITVVHELEGCLSEGVENRREETDTWAKKVASRELAQAKPKMYNVSAEIMIPTLQKLKEKLDNHDSVTNFGGHKDKDRLIQSYLNAPDYVLEEVEAGLKEKREVSDQGKRASLKGSSAFDKDSFDFSPDTAHCMRYGDLWYSVYMIKKPVVAQIVGIQLFDKHIVCDGSSQWRDLTKGKMIRIGTFLPKAEDDLPTISMTFTGEKMKKIQSAIDSDKYVLLIPSHVSDPSKTSFYPQFEGGPEEYMVVQSKDISSGGDCNMIGTSFEAFARQPRRCEQRKGSCLKRQPVDLWREDMEARISGKRGKYFVENFGKIPNSPIKSYTNFSGEFLALEYYGEYSSTIEIEVKADNNAIVTKRARAQIPTVYIDGTYPKKARIILSVLNIGLTSTYFRPRLGDCPPDLDPAWCPLEGPLVTIPPQQRHDFKLDLSGVLPPNKIHVTVQVLNQLNKKIAYRRIIIKKGDRCLCAFHCKCSCIGNAIAGRTCRKLTPQEYKGAGYVGSFPVRGGFNGTESVFASFEIVLVTASYILLLMGIMKGLFGVFIRRLGIAGTRVIVGPRKIRRYYECELECCTVLFDECGFPVHPTTCLPVQIVPLFVEVLLNFFFFFLYPIRGIMFLIMSCPCCKAVCSDCDGCWQQDDASDVDQKCSRPLLSKKQKKSSRVNYNLTTINTKKLKIDECLPYLLYKGDDDPLEDDDTEFVLRELKRYKEK